MQLIAETGDNNIIINMESTPFYQNCLMNKVIFYSLYLSRLTCLYYTPVSFFLQGLM